MWCLSILSSTVDPAFQGQVFEALCTDNNNNGTTVDNKREQKQSLSITMNMFLPVLSHCLLKAAVSPASLALHLSTPLTG